MDREVMNIFFISCSNYDYDGRTQELMKVASALGNLEGIVKKSVPDVVVENGIKYCPESMGYKEYIKQTIQYAKTKRIDILFVDNRKATVPALLIKSIKKINFIIYDMRELYLINEVHQLSSKIGCLPERRMISIADIVICANKTRADFVREQFKVNNVISYENIRKIDYSNNVNFELLEKKYEAVRKNDSFKVISTSGTSISRGNDKLLLDTLRLKKKIDIFLVGADENDKDPLIIKDIIEKNELSNVHVLGRMNHDELKYLISICDCGIVNYHSRDTNNKYCASGKIYEFLFEGKPVATTSNPPLTAMTEEYGIGKSSEDYYSSIYEVMSNYEYYVNNVKKYCDQISVSENNKELTDSILKIINKK